MINHARTLLLNQSGPGALNVPGEEFVPPDFVAVNLGEPFVSLRRVLFGSSPDRMFLNYRLQQYMATLHATELADYVTDLDPRITYWPPRTNLFFNESLYLPIVVQTAGDLPGRLLVTRQPELDEIAGRMVEAWQITITGGNEVSVRRLDKPFTATIPITLVKGLSAVFQLPGSNLKIILGKTDYENSPELTEVFRLFGKVDNYINQYDRAMYLTPPFAATIGGSSTLSSGQSNNVVELIGATWHVEAVARPTVDISRVNEQLSTDLPASWQRDLFGLAPVEPFATFQRLWQSHPALPYRMGGLLLALIYQTNLRR